MRPGEENTNPTMHTQDEPDWLVPVHVFAAHPPTNLELAIEYAHDAIAHAKRGNWAGAEWRLKEALEIARRKVERERRGT